MKRFLFFLLSLVVLFSYLSVVSTASDDAKSDVLAPTAGTMEIDARGAILIEASTGTVLLEQNADQAYPPASVTKIMTLLLVMEALDDGKIKISDPVTVSEYAASMGGSQVFLSPGETLTVEEMIKCAVISSANDAAVALAEFVSGSEESFVSEMNRRASELGMNNAHFENVTGLDDTTTDHRCSARDIAIMSRALISHKDILKYSSTWMDSIRDGEFTLTNTNRLIRFYQGATGLKTGSTAKAKFCLSATAERNGMTLIAVVMGSPSRDIRNEETKRLLDYGFANFALFDQPATELQSVKISGGTSDSLAIGHEGFSAVVKRGEAGKITTEIELRDSFSAPIEEGETVGRAVFRSGDRVVGETPIKALGEVGRITFSFLFAKMLRALVLG
ncbi:MAG: D-alanyl-D-alanine carboxypeptidase [Clostridia bacterium]|nr:D-alanyl-D-alanine carboxypeptidase [Clostridia bacterium]